MQIDMKPSAVLRSSVALAQASHLGSVFVFCFMVFLGTGGGGLSSGFRVLAFTTTALGTISGFLINEVRDQHIDSVAKTYRPLPSGRLGRKSALIWFAATYVGAWAGSFIVLAFSPSGIFLVAFMIMGTGYTPVKYRFGYLKNFYAAVCFSLPLLFSLVASGRLGDDWVLLVAVFCFLAHRELLMDRADLEADLSAGIATLALRLRGHGTALLASALWGVGVVVASTANLLPWQRICWIAVLITSSALLVLSMDPQPTTRWRGLTLLMWVPMAGFCVLLYR